MSCTLMSNTIPSGTTERLFNNTRKHQTAFKIYIFNLKMTFLLSKIIFCESSASRTFLKLWLSKNRFDKI